VHQETDLIIQFPQLIDPNSKCIINNNNNPNNYSFHYTSISAPIHLFPSIDLSIYNQRGVVAIFSQKDNAPNTSTFREVKSQDLEMKNKKSQSPTSSTNRYRTFNGTNNYKNCKSFTML
jgi:hypothetical protein